MFPEVGEISPECYYAYCNYEDSFRPDWVDRRCNTLIRALHHKNEQGVILLENLAHREDKPALVSLDKKKFLSKIQVMAVMKSLSVFHGSWWVWLQKEEVKKRSEVKDTIMNIDDVETAFMHQRHVSLSAAKMFFGPFMKGYIKLMETTDHAEATEALRECIQKKKMYERSDVMINPVNYSSKIKTVTHGDAWINNIMFTSSDPQVDQTLDYRIQSKIFFQAENLEATFLDYQQMILTHPAK